MDHLHPRNGDALNIRNPASPPGGGGGDEPAAVFPGDISSAPVLPALLGGQPIHIHDAPKMATARSRGASGEGGVVANPRGVVSVPSSARRKRPLASEAP